ncbi:hypothetical protein [Marinobacter qingdaonensis]|uniref:Uncharacterized protein n=1 Tax=Marinobacter qingdaonensis TaxID=3108486 RepID=A0ABU5NUN5_9GAMM|nr:hypothetical protein [Marinobacter sp. ASW11-75]MEA1079511.1 hypothetical protein [Marinobacter sp. ASW11-75]
MELKIKSRKLDRLLTFSRPGGTYIYVDANGRAGTQGEQICKGGETNQGQCLSYRGDDKKAFEAICRKWLSDHIYKTKTAGWGV